MVACKNRHFYAKKQINIEKYLQVLIIYCIFVANFK